MTLRQRIEENTNAHTLLVVYLLFNRRCCLAVRYLMPLPVFGHQIPAENVKFL